MEYDVWHSYQNMFESQDQLFWKHLQLSSSFCTKSVIEF